MHDDDTDGRMGRLLGAFRFNGPAVKPWLFEDMFVTLAMACAMVMIVIGLSV